MQAPIHIGMTRVQTGFRMPRLCARATIAAVALCLVLPPGLSAQAPEQRRAIDAFRDTLESATDSTLLRIQEARLLAVARQGRTDAFFHLRLGQLALREGALGGLSHYDDAASEYKWVTELAPQWPYAWYGLGLAEFALGDRAGGGRDREPVLARDAWSRATQAFARAAALEPGFAARLEQLAHRVQRERSPEKADVIRDALRRASQDPRGIRSARLVLALGRVQREMGDSGALAAFESYLASGDDRALGKVELGRTRLVAGDLAGGASYFDGADSEDPVAVAEYRADLAPLATDGQLADFDLRRGAARAEMLRRFWTSRDRIELRPDGERLAEHLRRLAVARREFVLVGADGVERFDDRGRIFVRHGEPDDRASFAVSGVEPNESWRYRRSGTDLVLHFVARQAPNDFRLVESMFDVSDVRGGDEMSRNGAPRPEPALHGSSTEQLLRSRSAISPLYRQVPPGRDDQVVDYLARERALGRRGIQVATRSDTHPLRFAQDLGAWGDLAVAGGTGAQPAVQVLFAIPGYAVEPATGAAGIVYPVRVRFVALDTAGNVVASIDTLTRIEPGDRIPANRSLMGRVSVPVRPGRLVGHAAVQYGERAGTTFEIDTLVVPSPGSSELSLGDLLVGTRRGRLLLGFGEGAPPLALSPGGIVRRSDGAELAVEVFGLESGAETRLRVYVAPRDGAEAGSGVALRWRPFPDGQAEAVVRREPGSLGIVRWRKWLALGKLKPGSWTVAVVATDSAGREVRREARLEVEVP